MTQHKIMAKCLTNTFNGEICGTYTYLTKGKEYEVFGFGEGMHEGIIYVYDDHCGIGPNRGNGKIDNRIGSYRKDIFELSITGSTWYMPSGLFNAEVKLTVPEIDYLAITRSLF